VLVFSAGWRSTNLAYDWGEKVIPVIQFTYDHRDAEGAGPCVRSLAGCLPW
jgi:hypothetical protein